MPKKSWSKGARKAYVALTRRYGARLGTRIFYAKANKVASAKTKGNPLNRRVSSVYAKGNTQAVGKGGTRKPKRAKS